MADTHRRNQGPKPARAILILALAVTAAIGSGEILRRILDGYALDRLALESTAEATAERPAAGREELRRLAEGMTASGGPDSSLFENDPVPPADFDLNPILEARRDAAPSSTYHVNFVFNDVFLKGPAASHYIAQDYPEDLFAFTSPDGSEHPRYRHYPNAAFSARVYMNDLGWRGDPVPLDKPARSIRIVGLGDSTTLHQSGIRISYLDYLCHWLTVRAREAGQDIEFECLNTGREAITSEDVLAILTHEVMPLEPDYILFYGLGNQWDVKEFVHLDEEAGEGWSGAEAYYKATWWSSLVQAALAPLTDLSATARWARNRLQAGIGDDGREPRKPRQTWTFPGGLSETDPNPDTAQPGPHTRNLVRDLDRMKALADAEGARFVLQSFKYHVEDGMVLPLPKAVGIFNYLNYGYFPYSYRNLRRAVDYLNRVYGAWAAKRSVPLLNVAGKVPTDYRFFTDAMHNTQTGVKLRAWAVFQDFLPLLDADLDAGRYPRPDKSPLTKHPFPLEVKVMKKSEVLRAGGN